jgi:hypothetical protein
VQNLTAPSVCPKSAPYSGHFAGLSKVAGGKSQSTTAFAAAAYFSLKKKSIFLI